MVDMKINQEKLGNLYSIIGSKGCRIVLEMLKDDVPKGYTEMKRKFNEKIGHDANTFSSFARKMIDNNLVKKDLVSHKYYLTRYGIQVLKLIKNFENICLEYDMDDCDAEGRVICAVVGRKL
jgi:predicted transcriptional regulator